MFTRRVVSVVARAATARVVPRVQNTAVRCCRVFSSGVVTSPFEAADADFVVFPREGAGLDYGLNWSLADDDVTPRGLAFRNADVQDLLMYAEGAVDKDTKLLTCGLGADEKAPLLCTDEFEGFTVADIDEFEERFERLKESFVSAPQLFVEDGAVGSDRSSEVRVRVITDSANYALFFRNMLNSVPLKDPQTFPRPLTVYIATKHNGGTYSVSDFDPEAARGVVAVSGSPGFEAVRKQVEHVAAQMVADGGYQGQRGGGVRVKIAREDGSLDFDDSHYIAESGAAQNIVIKGSAYVGEDGSTTINVGTEASTDNLFAAHACVWNATGVAQFWGGANVLDAAATDAGRGSIRCTGRTAISVDTDFLTAPPPSTIAVQGGAKDAAELASKLGLGEAAAELLQQRIADNGTKIVKATAAAAGGAKKKAASSGAGAKKKATSGAKAKGGKKKATKKKN